MSEPEYLRSVFGLEGRVALVSGARQGIGEAIAEGLARAGAAVAVTSRRPEELEPLLERLRATGRGAVGLGLEVTEPEQVDRCVADTVAELGRLDVLVSNAGLSLRADALELDVEDWDRVLDTNLRGPFLLARAAARAMRETGGGRIVNLSSPFARVGLRDRAAYSASKGGLEALTRALAAEWAPYGITVNAVAPTTVVTETRAELFRDEKARQARAAQIPLGRLATAEDVVGPVLMLCAAAGSFVTGETLLVDGGYSVWRS